MYTVSLSTIVPSQSFASLPAMDFGIRKLRLNHTLPIKSFRSVSRKKKGISTFFQFEVSVPSFSQFSLRPLSESSRFLCHSSDCFWFCQRTFSTNSLLPYRSAVSNASLHPASISRLIQDSIKEPPKLALIRPTGTPLISYIFRAKKYAVAENCKIVSAFTCFHSPVTCSFKGALNSGFSTILNVRIAEFSQVLISSG